VVRFLASRVSSNESHQPEAKSQLKPEAKSEDKHKLHEPSAADIISIRITGPFTSVSS